MDGLHLGWRRLHLSLLGVQNARSPTGGNPARRGYLGNSGGHVGSVVEKLHCERTSGPCAGVSNGSRDKNGGPRWWLRDANFLELWAFSQIFM